MSVPDDPWAPPPEAVQERAGWPAYPDAPRGWRPSGWGPWPEGPEGPEGPEAPRPSDPPVVRAGVALVAAMTLTGAGLWALTRAAAVRVATDNERQFGAEVPFATRWGPPAAAALLTVLAAVAWVVRARLARRHPSGSALTPWFLAGWFLAVTVGLAAGHLVVGAFSDLP